MTLDELQQLIDRMYSRKDQARGVEGRAARAVHWLHVLAKTTSWARRAHGLRPASQMAPGSKTLRGGHLHVAHGGNRRTRSGSA